MREKQLSKRLQAVVSLVTPGRRVADVGCDHAYVSIYLIEHGLAKNCIALDVREGPLQRARRNIEAHRLSERIQTRIGSGLEPVNEGEIDTVLMAGMGGILVRDLLEQSQTVSHSLREWVLQPQSDIDLVRRYIRESGFVIAEEKMVKEDGKYYPMFRAVPTERRAVLAEQKRVMEEQKTISAEQRAVPVERSTDLREQKRVMEEQRIVLEEAVEQEIWDRFGKLLLQQRHPVLYEFLKEREQHYSQVLLQMQQQMTGQKEQEARRLVIQKETEYVRRALQYWEDKGEEKQ